MPGSESGPPALPSRAARALRLIAASGLVVVVASGLSAVGAGPASAYQPPRVDVTAKTVSNLSAPGVVEVIRTVTETPGKPASSIPVLAYAYEMNPTIPSELRGSVCEVYRDDALVLEKSCTFATGFFQDELKNPASGRYKLVSAGTTVSQWTYTAPKLSKPPALKPAGCRITGLSVTPKPQSTQPDTSVSGDPATTYTMRASGTRVGNCKGIKWSYGVAYSAESPSGGIRFGFTSGSLKWSGSKLTGLEFTLRDSDTAVSDFEFQLQISGVTPGWRANLVTRTEFTVKP